MGLHLPQQPYIVKEVQEHPRGLQSNGDGLMSLHNIQHIHEDNQAFFLTPALAPCRVSITSSSRTHLFFACMKEFPFCEALTDHPDP